MNQEEHLMDTQIIADDSTVQVAKIIRIFSYVALALSGVYFLEGAFSFLFALLPIPIIGFIISVVLSIIEFILLVGAVVFGILAYVRANQLIQMVTPYPDNDEKKECLKCGTLARKLSIISLVMTGTFCVMLTILNVLELLLSFI